MLVRKLEGYLWRYHRCEDGAVLPLIGVASIALVATMGLAIDAGRAALVHAKLLTSADASGLAIGARMSTTDLNAEAAKFVNANFPAGYAGATVTSVTATANDDGSVITVNASATMPTTLLRLVGYNSVDLDVTSETTRAVSGLELVLALDNTGSMVLPASKLASLKTAANDLLDIVFGDDGVADDLYVGVVPFSQAVNIGTGKSAWISANTFDWGENADGSNHAWAGCVADRGNGRDQTDDPPSTQKFPAYYYKDVLDVDQMDRYSDANYTINDWRDWHYVNGQCIKMKNNKCAQYEQVRVYDYEISFQRAESDRTPNKYCPARVTPMTSSKSTVATAINNMKATGATHINLGAVWGWRMLSPRWRDLWGGEMDTEDLPLAYNTPRMNKALVLMTDGDNTMYDWSYFYSAYGTLSDGKLGTTSDVSAAEEELDDRLSAVCSSMKNAGIIVYTVSFGTVAAETKTLLQSCATQAAYYFHSPTGAALRTAFKTIGDSLANLRVSK